MTAAPHATHYRQSDQLYLWLLTKPEQPVPIGELNLVRSTQGVSLRYDGNWLERGFPLSEDLPLIAQEFLPTDRAKAAGAVAAKTKPIPRWTMRCPWRACSIWIATPRTSRCAWWRASSTSGRRTSQPAALHAATSNSMRSRSIGLSSSTSARSSCADVGLSDCRQPAPRVSSRPWLLTGPSWRTSEGSEHVVDDATERAQHHEAYGLFLPELPSAEPSS